MKTPKDIIELRDSLLDAYASLEADPRRMLQVRELTNAAGKILMTAKLQAEYALAKGQEPDIPFLGKTSGKLLAPTASRLLHLELIH